MGGASKALEFPTLEQIVAYNRRHIHETGGNWTEPDNLKERGSLEWVLEAIQYPLFDRDLYPTPVDKVAQLIWIIIQGHVFWDGNKRTAMSVAEITFEVNGYRLSATDQEVVDVAIWIATSSTTSYTIETFKTWLESRVVPFR